MSPSDELLHEAIEGRIVPGPAHAGVASLARLAGRVRLIAVAGPGVAATARMTERFEELIEGRRRTGLAVWLLGWLGAGPRPRALVQQFAAGAFLVAAATTGAGAATGHTPIETFEGIARFAANAAANLDPAAGDGTAGSPGEPGSAPQLPGAGGSVTPAAASATAVATPGTATQAAAATEAATAPASGQDQRPAQPPPGTPPPAVTATPVVTATPPASPSPEATPTPPKPTTTPAATATPKPSSTASPPPGGTPTPSPTPSPTPTQPPGQTYSAGEAGTVTLRVVGNALEIVSVQPNSGWTVTKQQESGSEAEVDFKQGERKVQFKATLHDGEVTVSVEEEGSEEGGD